MSNLDSKFKDSASTLNWMLPRLLQHGQCVITVQPKRVFHIKLQSQGFELEVRAVSLEEAVKELLEKARAEKRRLLNAQAG